MRFKIDQNLPEEVAEMLRSAGHDAETAREEGPAHAKDSAIAEVCRSEKRMIVTCDLDFGDIRT